MHACQIKIGFEDNGADVRLEKECSGIASPTSAGWEAIFILQEVYCELTQQRISFLMDNLCNNQ